MEMILVNKKGFTLIETIIVVAILALLMLVLVPNVISLIGKNNKESCKNLEKNIISATKIYVNMNKYDLLIKCHDPNKADETTLYIKLQTLVDSGDLKADTNGKIINPIDDSDILSGTNEEIKHVPVTYDCTSRTFSYNYNLDCE